MTETYIERISYGQRVELLIDWLATRDPDDWHRVARSYNWDDDMSPLIWILRQGSCDRATAQYIFWTSQPYDILDGANDETMAHYVADGFELVKELCARWSAGQYSRSTIEQDLENDKDDRAGLMEFLNELRANGKQLIDVPLDICDPLAGRSIDLMEGQYQEGWPEELFDKLWRKQRSWPIETIRKMLGI